MVHRVLICILSPWAPTVLILNLLRQAVKGGLTTAGQRVHHCPAVIHFVQSIVHPMIAHRTSVWPPLAEGHPFIRGHRYISDVLDLLYILYFQIF